MQDCIENCYLGEGKNRCKIWRTSKVTDLRDTYKFVIKLIFPKIISMELVSLVFVMAPEEAAPVFRYRTINEDDLRGVEADLGCWI